MTDGSRFTRVEKYRILLASSSGRTREWRGLAMSEDAAIEYAEAANPGFDVHTLGPDLMEGA